MSYLALAKRLLGKEPTTELERLDTTDCLELLGEMHAGIRAEYVDGALSLLDADPVLARRFQATEARIDALAKVPGGPPELEFRAAIEAHAAIWHEIIARHRAQQEQQAERSDPMPELPADTVAAVGISYADSEPGTWDVVRRRR